MPTPWASCPRFSMDLLYVESWDSNPTGLILDAGDGKPKEPSRVW